MIESAQYSNAEQSSISVVYNGKQYSVPVAEGNRWYQRLLEWVHQPSDQWYQDWESYAAARDAYNEWLQSDQTEPEPVVPAKPPELTELPVVNPIADYVAPPPPTDDQRIDSVYSLSDTDQVIFKMIFELVNEVRVLKGQGEINGAQFRDYLKTKLP